MKALLLVMVLLSVGGCALFESKATRTMHASADYKAGYSDGCSSASDAGANPNADNQVRDDAAFAGNAAYRTGWREGFGGCRAAARQAGTGPAMPMPGRPNF